MDPYPLVGWRWIDVDGQRLLEGPQGKRCETTMEAFDFEMSTRTDGTSKAPSQQLNFLHKFINEYGGETFELNPDDGGARVDGDDIEDSKVDRQTVTTGPLEDWLWRGDHPVLKDMHWYLYSMWVYRVEVLPLKLNDDGEPMVPGPRFIDIDFSPDYKLHRTHRQRIATEFRVPLYEGFTMPPSTRDSETAAMYKSLLLRDLSIKQGDEPEDVRFARSFEPLCVVEGEELDGNQAAPQGRMMPASSCQKDPAVWMITRRPVSEKKTMTARRTGLRLVRLHAGFFGPSRAPGRGSVVASGGSIWHGGCRRFSLPWPRPSRAPGWRTWTRRASGPRRPPDASWTATST